MTLTRYDFRKPGRLHGALEQQFHAWAQAACALAGRRWQRDLPVPLELHPLPFDTVHAPRALQGLPEDCVGYRVLLQDQLPTVMAWPRRLTLALVETLLGDTVTALPEDRELTAVDDSLFEFFLRDLLLPSFLDTWTGKAPLRTTLGEKVPHPRWAKLFGADETLLVAPVQLKGPFGDQGWRWLLPKKGLQANLGEKQEEADAAASQERLHARVNELHIEVAVRLGTVALPLPQISRLRAGDVILLDQRIDRPLHVEIEGKEKFQGWPARVGQRQAVQLEKTET